jgi:Nineteen complex-related protein 2
VKSVGRGAKTARGSVQASFEEVRRRNQVLRATADEEEETGFEIKRTSKRNNGGGQSGSSISQAQYSKEYLQELQSAYKRPTVQKQAKESLSEVTGDETIIQDIEGVKAIEVVDVENAEADVDVDADVDDEVADEENEEDFIPLAQDELQLVEGDYEEEFTNELDIDEGRGFEDGSLPLRDEDIRVHDEQRRQEMRQAIEDQSDSESDDWTLSQTRMGGSSVARQTRPKTPEIAPLPDLASVLYHLKEVYERKNDNKTQLLDQLEILRKDIESLDTRMEQVQDGLNEASAKYERAENKLSTRESSVVEGS